MRLDVGRGRHQQLRHFEEQAGDVARVPQRRRDPHRQVEAVPDQIAGPVIEQQRHADLRLPGRERRDGGHQVRGAERRRRADPDQATRLGHGVAHAGLQGLELTEQAGAAVQQPGAGLGEPDVLRAAAEELGIHQPF